MDYRSSVQFEDHEVSALFQPSTEFVQANTTTTPAQESRIRLRISGTNRIISIPRSFNATKKLKTPE